MEKKRAKLTLYESMVVKFAAQLRVFDLEKSIKELTDLKANNIAKDADLLLLETHIQEKELLLSAIKKLFYFTSVEL